MFVFLSPKDEYTNGVTDDLSTSQPEVVVTKACNILNCLNGHCDENDRCLCNSGFEGIDCSIPITTTPEVCIPIKILN